jgi:hypothetical protein
MEETLTPDTTNSYSTSYVVDQSPDEVFAAILDVDAWWTGEIEGRADEVGATFTYRHPPQHESVQHVVELEPGRRVVWRVTDSHLSFANPPSEWTGTEIVFDLTPVGSGTELRFTHVGLVPEVDCFEACSSGWLHYASGSLRSLITTGKGLPDPW